MQMSSTLESTELSGRGGGGGGATAAGPYQQAIELTFGAGVNEITGTVTVPAGLLLVIETVTADVGVANNEQPFVFVSTVVRGVTAQHTIALQELPRSPNVFGATHDVRLYADAGTTVTIMVTRFGASPYPAIPKPELVTISGRLEH